MEDLLDFILRSIVTNPKAVAIDTQTVDSSVTFMVSADKEDIGKIIGKGGHIIKAIRSLLRIVAEREHTWVNIEIQEQG